MVCKRCESEPVYTLTSGVSLCKSCFVKYFEKKVRKTIRIYSLIKKGDRICVAISGGKDSLTVLNILNNLAKKMGYFEIFALLIDEGIKNYREHTLEDARKFCNDNDIKLHVASFKEEFGYTLDEMIDILKMKPCTVCGVLRRYLLNKKARELKADKLTTGHNLDDEAQTVIMNQFKRNIGVSARLGPMTGVKDDERFIRRIKPLYLMTEKEVGTYAFIKKFLGSFNECTYEHDSFRSEVRDMINDFEMQHHGTKNNIITSFLEIMPLLKSKYKNESVIAGCSKCKEPCSGEICKACLILEKIKEKN